MARCLSRFGLCLAGALLLAAAPRSDAQTPEVVEEKTGAPKPPTPQEVDGLIERLFGVGSVETRRPIRLWIADIGMAVTANKASVAPDGRSVRLLDVSLAFPAEKKILRGEEVLVELNQAVMEVAHLQAQSVASAEIKTKNGTIALLVQGEEKREFKEVTRTVQVTEKVPFVPPPPPSNVNSPKFEPKRPVNVRFTFKIDLKTPPAELLPKPVAARSKWIPFNEDLSKAPEIAFGDPIAKDLDKQNAMEATAHAMAKINHLNRKKTDGFMLALLERRDDLRGMPVLMGEECRTREAQALAFTGFSEVIQKGLQEAKTEPRKTEAAYVIWGEAAQMMVLRLVDTNERGVGPMTANMVHKASVAALMQILMPENDYIKFGLVKVLSTIPHADATKALAKLAIFAPEDDVRAAAIEALKVRRERDATAVLVEGLRYPLSAVAKRSAEAIVKLERADLIAELLDVLERPDPRLPVVEKRDGKEVAFVREIVKVNHHRNCLLCHAPGNTDNVPEGVLTVAVPLTTEALPKPAEGGGYQKTPATNDIVVRLDMTYLRQDFSLMMPVADAHPWPEMQRFDFLVRTRLLAAEDLQSFKTPHETEPGRLSPYQRAALFALRELTGRDTEPTGPAWRKMLNVPKGS